ncbi:MAG: helix-turn-helix domain-containing protein [Clostridiales bacterium]|nr:helix-turn-helix domain-containing protein [Clostridiales bacterium]
MTRAKEMLAFTCKPISEIAKELDYANVQNFIRMFRQNTSMAPTEYRQKFDIDVQRQI